MPTARQSCVQDGKHECINACMHACMDACIHLRHVCRCRKASHIGLGRNIRATIAILDVKEQNEINKVVNNAMLVYIINF